MNFDMGRNKNAEKNKLFAEEIRQQGAEILSGKRGGCTTSM